MTLSGTSHSYDTNLISDSSSAIGFPVNVNQQCVHLWNVVCDEWDLKGSHGFSDPLKSLKDWPRRFQDAVTMGDVPPGMSRETVPWAKGWPQVQYKSFEQASKSDTWVFHDGSPWDYTVYFKNGKVSGVNNGPDMP